MCGLLSDIVSFIRIENMKDSRLSLTNKFKESIHYVSSSLLSKNKQFIKESPCKLLTIISIPIGLCLYRHIMKNT